MKIMWAGVILNAGFHVYEWDATNDAGQQMASGVYIYRIQANNFTAIKKMTILK